MLLYALTELGYIFFWLLSDKPYELYTVLNIGKWDGKLSRFQTDEKANDNSADEPFKKVRILDEDGLLKKRSSGWNDSSSVDDIYITNNNREENQWDSE